MILNHLFQNIPYFFVLPLQHLLRAFDRIGVTFFLQFADDEGLIQFQCDLFRQSALMQFQPRTDHNHTTRRIIDSFTEQVFTEPTLLTFDHVGQRFQRAVTASQHRSFTAVVVEQSVNRLLQHSFFIANDDFRSIQIHQFPQAVITVDDTTIEVVQVTRGKVTRVQQNQRTQIRGNDGDDVQDHPLRLIVAVANRFHDFQAIGEVFRFLLGTRFRQVNTEFFRQLN